MLCILPGLLGLYDMFKLIIGFVLLHITTIAYAGSVNIFCPSVAEIKNGNFGSWLLLYTDGEELVSNQDVEIFKSQITSFNYAKWNAYYLEAAHCVYGGNDAIFNKVILAHDAWGPVVSEHWRWVGKYEAVCDLGEVVGCGFVI